MEKFEDFDLPEEQRSKFTEEYRKQIIPPDLEDRTVQELKRRGFFRRPSSFLLKPAVFLLVIGILFSSGFFLGRNSRNEGNSPPTENRYLLLLYNTPSSLETISHAKEYGQWFHSLNNAGIDGDELQSKGWSLVANNKPIFKNASAATDMATGYFLIHANSDAEALNLAATCPHLKYKGQIEVRPIQTHN